MWRLKKLQGRSDGVVGVTAVDRERFLRRFESEAMTRGQVVDEFVEWLLHTPDGDEALRHINETKRQRFLGFESQVKTEGEWR